MHIAEIPDAVPDAPHEVTIGQLPPDFVPYSAGQISEQSNSGTVATKLPTDADILRASADDSPNPPAPVDRLACAC